MNKYVPIGKRSKAAQKEFYASQRCTWNGLNPVTRTVKNGKAYDRNRQKEVFRRNSRDYQDGSPAVFCCPTCYLQRARST
jgi:hypothetical protein